MSKAAENKQENRQMREVVGEAIALVNDQLAQLAVDAVANALACQCPHCVRERGEPMQGEGN